MILGIGHDLIKIERIAKAIERHGSHFLNKLFSENEIAYCRSKHAFPTHFAGRFAAKEAIVKALGTGFGSQVGWLDIEIINDSAGKPVVFLSDEVKALFQYPHILVTISHCKEHASAFAIWEQHSQ